MTEPLKKKTAIFKIISGLVLMITGVFGFIFGRKAKTKVLRLSIFIMAGLSIFSGFYLFVSGISDMAVMQMDVSTWDGPLEMRFDNPQHFKESLRETSNGANLRRLYFKCTDESKEFTVYFTKLGIFNIPKKNVICNNGTKLLTYKMER